MRTGDVVRKKAGYQFIGYIIADFIKTTGERRLVVEEIRSGMLHIFNPEQVETFQYEKGTCLECGQEKIYHL